VITDDYSRFTWVFFLATKDETTPILKNFLTGLENQLSLKRIKREFSVPRTPQQNGIAKRKNRTLIEAARTMLADSLLPILFWAEAVNTACYEHDFDVKKPESKVILSLSSNAQSKEQDDQTKKEAKGKSHVESVTGYKDLNAEFEDCSKNSSNEVTTASSTVPTVGQNSINNTNTFSAVGLEDIIYSDDENVVGAEANFNNLESSILVSPIPTTRIHKDHPVSQIIGDLSSTTQTRSMTRAIKDQGGLSQIFVKALYGLHQAPRAWYKVLATYLLENGFQRGTIDQTLFIKKQKRDILLVQIYVDDIIFGATNKDLCRSFEKLIKDKFQMSSIGELTFFLGLQQTVVATSSTEAEYVAAASFYTQVL
nr:putative ribonuclease H-like domain-containing protein [Tanacetum cinerariifolium]